MWQCVPSQRRSGPKNSMVCVSWVLVRGWLVLHFTAETQIPGRGVRSAAGGCCRCTPQMRLCPLRLGLALQAVHSFVHVLELVNEHFVLLEHLNAVNMQQLEIKCRCRCWHTSKLCITKMRSSRCFLVFIGPLFGHLYSLGYSPL